VARILWPVVLALALVIGPAPASAASTLAISVAPGQVQIGGRALVRVTGAAEAAGELVVWQRLDASPCGSDLPGPPTILLSQGALGLAGPAVAPGAVVYRTAAWTREPGTFRVCAALWTPGASGGATLAATGAALLTVAAPWTVSAEDSGGRGGGAVPLTFVVAGASRVSAQLRVLDHAKVVYSKRTPMQTARDGARRIVVWKTAPALYGSFALCVTARDPGGHVERADHCSTITVEDGQAPRVQALPSSGTAGDRVTLRYVVSDNSGHTQEQLRILRGREVLDEVDTKLSPSKPGQRYGVVWAARPDVVGTVSFCVVSKDAAGNRSAPSCASLELLRPTG
jgi:hypothetical protein